MNRRWNFTDLEFVVLCESADEDRLPPPFVFTSRTLLYDDFLREKARARNRLEARLGRSFEHILQALFHPDIRVVVDGWGGPEASDPERCVRLYAARRGDIGYVVQQLPGETIWHSGGFVMAECDAVELADAIASLLPSVDAGRRPDVVIVTDNPSDEMDYAYGQSAVEDSFDDSVLHRSAIFLGWPTSTTGIIEVVQGNSRFGPRGISRRQIRWRDLIDDGRYAITTDVPSIAVGVDIPRLRTMINNEIATVIRAIKDERV